MDEVAMTAAAEAVPVQQLLDEYDGDDCQMYDPSRQNSEAPSEAPSKRGHHQSVEGKYRLQHVLTGVVQMVAHARVYAQPCLDITLDISVMIATPFAWQSSANWDMLRERLRYVLGGTLACADNC